MLGELTSKTWIQTSRCFFSQRGRAGGKGNWLLRTPPKAMALLGKNVSRKYPQTNPR
eukprot:jgi/Mesvir1/14174/Mv25147-RA.1